MSKRIRSYKQGKVRKGRPSKKQSSKKRKKTRKKRRRKTARARRQKRKRTYEEIGESGNGGLEAPTTIRTARVLPIYLKNKQEKKGE